MNGLQKYSELVRAIQIVNDAKVGLYREALYSSTPASNKLIRVGAYLDKQAENAMEGRTEDGKEEGDVTAGRTLLKALGVPVEQVPYIADGDVAIVVEHMMSTRGYSQDEAEDVEARMERTKCSLSGLSGEQERIAGARGGDGMGEIVDMIESIRLAGGAQ